MSKNAKDKSKIVQRIPKACWDEEYAVTFLEHQRWPDTPTCAHCESENVYQMRGRDGERNKRYLWRCRDCGKQYTVRVGTVFEDSRIPLQHWCYAFWRACSSKKGVSALEIKRQTGLSYKSALFMMHRIRFAMSDDPATPEPLTGVVEADETYVGGKPRKPRQPREKWTEKTPVAAIVQRGGEVRARVMPTVNAKNLKAMLRQNVHPSATVNTDEASWYRGLGKEYAAHKTVVHMNGQYVDGDAYTNTVEGFFSLLKRGIHGSYHSVSKKHLHRYVAEFQFRWNHRHVEDGARTVAAIRKSVGKRLRYCHPTKTH